MKRKKREEKRKRKGEWKEGEKKEYEIGGGDSWDGLTGFHRFPSLNFFVRARHDSTFARRANSKARALSTMQLYRRSTWASTPVISGMIQLSRKRLVDSRHEKRFPSLSLFYDRIYVAVVEMAVNFQPWRERLFFSFLSFFLLSSPFNFDRSNPRQNYLRRIWFISTRTRIKCSRRGRNRDEKGKRGRREHRRSLKSV